MCVGQGGGEGFIRLYKPSLVKWQLARPPFVTPQTCLTSTPHKGACGHQEDRPRPVLCAHTNTRQLIAIKKIAPALAAGNSVVVKPSELAPVAVLEFAKLCHDAGVPSGVLNVVTGYGAAAGKAGLKSAGVVVDDAAVTPRYVTGFTPDRELPIIWRIARGSLFELMSHVEIANELGHISPNQELTDLMQETDRVLQGLLRYLEESS